MTTDIFAAEDWYRERPEPEAEWRGVLRERRPVIGPANRTALFYALVTTDEELAVYAAGSPQKFTPYLDQPVVVRGKRVDLGAEGFGPELWAASIRPDTAADAP